MKYRNVAAAVLTALPMSLVLVASPAFARSRSPLQATQQSGQQKGQLSQPSQAGQQQTLPTQQSFTGTISKSAAGSFELKANGVTYKLDNSSEAAKYVGKKVTVKGSLDTSTNTITVTSIESSGM